MLSREGLDLFHCSLAEFAVAAFRSISAHFVTPDTNIAEQKKLLTLILEHSTAMPFRWSCNKYLCFYCCSEFVESSKLKEHTLIEHENPKLSNVMKNLPKEVSVKLDISNITCKRCVKPIQNLNGLAKHVSEAHDVEIDRKSLEFIYVFNLTDDGMNCIDCGQSFRFFGPLLMHAHKYHNKLSPYLCEVCGRGFVSKKSMRSHVRLTHSKTAWSCEYCKDAFPSHQAVKYHKYKTHLTGKFKCPKCPETLGSTYLKKKHLALVHDVKSVQFPCDKCPQVYTQKNSLLNHKQRVHMEQKTVACDICGFRVICKEYLSRHLVKHTDERPFECEYCKKTFQRKKTLKFHIRIHTNDRRYVCNDCGKAFIQTSSLKSHMRTHHAALK